MFKLSQLLRRARPGDNHRAELGSRQIYILPTRFGVLYAILVLALLIGSINYTNNLGFLLTFLLAGQGVLTMHATWRNLRGLQLKAQLPGAVFANQSAGFPLRVYGNGRARPSVQIEISDADWDGSWGIVDAPAEGSARLQLDMPAGQRGWLHGPELVVASRYPLGLLRAWSLVELDSACLVYPAPAAYFEPPGGAHYSGSEQGDRGVGADDFVSHRPYRAGDSPRHIDWKALAREKGLLSKQFGGDRSNRLWLDFDDLPVDDTELRLSLLARAVLDAEQAQQEYGLQLPNRRIELGRGHDHQHQCLRALALYGGEAA